MWKNFFLYAKKKSFICQVKTTTVEKKKRYLFDSTAKRTKRDDFDKYSLKMIRITDQEIGTMYLFEASDFKLFFSSLLLSCLR